MTIIRVCSLWFTVLDTKKGRWEGSHRWRCSPHRTQAGTPISQQEIQPSQGPRHAPSMGRGLSPRPLRPGSSHLADSFHSIWSPSCCRVSISVKRVGLGASSSSPRMSCSCSAAGDPEKMKELGLPSAQPRAAGAQGPQEPSRHQGQGGVFLHSLRLSPFSGSAQLLSLWTIRRR